MSETKRPLPDLQDIYQDGAVGEVGAHTPNPLAQTIITVPSLIPPRVPKKYRRVGGNLSEALAALDPSQLKSVEYLLKMIRLARSQKVRFYETVGALVLISSLTAIEIGPRHSRDIKKLGPMIRPLLTRLRQASKTR